MFLSQSRCRCCHGRFHGSEVGTFGKGPEAGYLPVKRAGARKFAIARSRLSHDWKSRYFVLSPVNDGTCCYTDKAAATVGSEKQGGDTKSDGSASHDADAEPGREALEARRAQGLRSSEKELRLVLQCGTIEERSAWITALEAHRHAVNNLTDYSSAANAAAKANAKEKKMCEEVYW
ncbi:hypothetical protein CGC20_35995 [Leishmania donovani]|uniref:PH domain-containing protein n=1 Tax=Leishmania donovani TaxID=5661 RepID=A0A504XZT2_LEIDO|nr:hypothetical protein CGC20_35995 [Leishmania donovani]